MAGLFDDFSFGNPQSMALLGALAGLGQAAAPSRMPVTFGQVLGSLAGGAMQGAQVGYQGRKEDAQAKLYEAQVIEALRRASVLSQFNLNDVLGKSPAPAPPGQVPVTPTPSMAMPSQSSAGSSGGLAPGFARDATGRLTYNGQPPDSILSNGQPAWKAEESSYSGSMLPRIAALAAQQHGIDPSFYTSAIDAESGFNPVARNPTSVNGENAIGVAQFMPSTAKQYGVDPLNAGQALQGGARYYADLLKKNGGDYIKAAQAYGTLPKNLDNLNHKQQRVLQVAQALNSGQTVTDAVPAPLVSPQTSGGGQSMSVPPGAGAINIDPIALAKQRAILGLGGISGDPLSGFAQAYYNSPQYKSAIAAQEAWARVQPELATRWASPEWSPQQRARIEAAIAAAKQPTEQQNEVFKGQVAAAQESNKPITKVAGQDVDINPNRVGWPAPAGAAVAPQSGAAAAPGAPGGGPITIEGGSIGQQQFEKELGQKNAENFQDRRGKALDAATALQNTQYARELLDKGVLTGTAANWKLVFGKALQEVGVHLNDNAVSNTEAYIAARAQDVGTLIKNFGSGTGLSDADREYASLMAAQKITLTEQSMRKILDILDRGGRNVIEKFNEDASKVSPSLSPYPLTVPMPEKTKAAPPPAESNRAAIPAVEGQRTIGGKTYIKQGGQWYRQD